MMKPLIEEERLILVKSQLTGELFRCKFGIDLHPDLKRVKKLGGYRVHGLDGKLFDSFKRFKLIPS